MRCSSKKSLPEVLAEDPDIFLTMCKPCSYQPPSSSPHAPRQCIPAVRSCLSQTVLEGIRREHVSNVVYAALVTECVTGELNMVQSLRGEIFKNSACAECNGVPSHELICFLLSSRDEVPEQCIPVSATSPSPTTSSKSHVTPLSTLPYSCTYSTSL